MLNIDVVKNRIEHCRDCHTHGLNSTSGPYTFLDLPTARILIIGPIVNMLDASAINSAFEKLGANFFGADWVTNGMYDFTSAIRCTGVKYSDAISNCVIHTKNICAAKHYDAYISVGDVAHTQIDPDAPFYEIQRTASNRHILFLPVLKRDNWATDKKGAELVDSLLTMIYGADAT